MPAYLVAEMEVSDPKTYERYRACTSLLLRLHLPVAWLAVSSHHDALCRDHPDDFGAGTTVFLRDVWANWEPLEG